MKTRMVKIVVIVSVIIALIGIIFWKTSPKQKKAIVIGLPTWVGYAPFYLAANLGYYEQLGIKVDLRRIDNVPALVAGLKAGSLDGLGSTVDTMVRHYAEGLPIRIVLALDESKGGDGIIATNAIQSIRELKGKAVALQEGSPSHFFLLYLMNEAGMAFDDVKILPMEPGDAGAAFVAGKLDAAVTWEPWLSKASERKGGHILISSAECPGLIIDNLVITKKTLNERPDDIKKLIQAWFMAIQFWNKETDKANKIMGQSLGLSSEEFMDMLSGISFLNLEDNKKYFSQSGTEGSIFHLAEKASQFWLNAKITQKEVSKEEIIEPAFIRELN